MGTGRELFSRHYPELDLARAAAITLVLLCHFSAIYMKDQAGPLRAAFDWGWHGVDLFFALSGFLIGGQLIESCSAGRFSLRSFFLKRLFRIVPPYLVAIAAFVTIYSYKSGFFILERPQVLRDTLAHLLYLQDYLHFAPMMQNGIYWSLAVEEKFYIVLPFIVLALAARPRALLPVLVLLAAASAAARFAAFDPRADFWGSYLVPFHLRFDNLLYGVLAAFIYIRARGSFGPPFKWLFLAAAAACLALTFLYGGLETTYFNVCWQFTLSGVGFSAVVLALMAFGQGRPLPAGRAISAVARYSYTMYLYHLLALGLAHPYLKHLFRTFGTGPMATMAVFAAYFAVVLASSAAIYTLVDRRFLAYRRRVVERLDTGSLARGKDAREVLEGEG